MNILNVKNSKTQLMVHFAVLWRFICFGRKYEPVGWAESTVRQETLVAKSLVETTATAKQEAPAAKPGLDPHSLPVAV